VTYVPAWGS